MDFTSFLLLSFSEYVYIRFMIRLSPVCTSGYPLRNRPLSLVSYCLFTSEGGDEGGGGFRGLALSVTRGKQYNS